MLLLVRRGDRDHAARREHACALPASSPTGFARVLVHVPHRDRVEAQTLARGEVGELPSHTSSPKWSARVRGRDRAVVHAVGVQPRRRATGRKRPVPQPTSSSRPGARTRSIASSQRS
jgi:hypothetical protein